MRKEPISVMTERFIDLYTDSLNKKGVNLGLGFTDFTKRFTDSKMDSLNYRLVNLKLLLTEKIH